MTSFIIYPAIDLRNGQVVRLQYGDPTLQTTYSNDPTSFAEYWLNQGAEWLHVINLDAAFGEVEKNNLIAIKDILTHFGEKIKIQIGGGIRSLDQINYLMDLGVIRVILGTIAVKNPNLVKTAVKTFGAEKIVIGVDARDGFVKTHGWQETETLSPIQLASQLKEIGIITIIYTDIARDGAGTGINLENTVSLAEHSGLHVIASGGVNSYQDVVAVKNAGLPGVVVGKALYDKKINPEILFKLQTGAEPC